MAHRSPPNYHRCTRLRIETFHAYDESVCWYRVYADAEEVAVIFGASPGAPPLVAIDSPSRLVIGGDAP